MRRAIDVPQTRKRLTRYIDCPLVLAEQARFRPMTAMRDDADLRVRQTSVWCRRFAISERETLQGQSSQTEVNAGDIAVFQDIGRIWEVVQLGAGHRLISR